MTHIVHHGRTIPIQNSQNLIQDFPPLTYNQAAKTPITQKTTQNTVPKGIETFNSSYLLKPNLEHSTNKLR